MNRETLKYKLRERGITLTDVALAAGVTEVSVHRWLEDGSVGEKISACIEPVVKALAKQSAAAVRADKAAALKAASEGARC